jgi:hypothetical protein
MFKSCIFTCSILHDSYMVWIKKTCKIHYFCVIGTTFDKRHLTPKVRLFLKATRMLSNVEDLDVMQGKQDIK